VALLIGNSDYKSETPLNASTIDVQMLSESFRALDFRVVSLLNLTKPEIENAVLHFKELLGENVYAVFYFCGHGFEEHGMSYLVPTDAPAAYTAQECVCAQEILANIQKKEPPVIFMILDICRQE
jgi:mucosa-associated lymphoid tissue lymphoma translocation protein 1